MEDELEKVLKLTDIMGRFTEELHKAYIIAKNELIKEKEEREENEISKT